MKKHLSNLPAWCNKHEWIILLLLLTVILRFPTLFAPHYYGDEEIYFVMGRAWRNEGMYATAFDHKPPLIYVIAGITQSVFWFRTALLTWMLVHTWLFWQLAKKFWARLRPKMAYVSSLLFVFVMSLPTFEGHVANAELFMMMPVTLSLLLLMTAGKRGWKYGLAGSVAGVGLLFKVPVLFDVVGILIYFFAFNKKSFREGLRSLLDWRLWLYVAMFVLPFALSILNYQLKGAGTEYIKASVLVNFGYVSSWKTGNTAFNPLQSGLLVRGIVLAVYTLGLYLLRKKLDKEYLLALIWFGFSSFGALLSARPYPHYLLQPAVPAALLLPFVLVIERALAWVVMGGVVLLAILVQRNIGFGAYPAREVFQNFWLVATRQITPKTYREMFSSAKMNYEVAEYLNAHMTEGDKLYVWGNDVTIYNLTDKALAGGKYMVDFHVRDWQAYTEVMNNLNTNRPAYVVILPNAIPFAELESWLSRDYFWVTTIEGAEVWHRL